MNLIVYKENNYYRLQHQHVLYDQYFFLENNRWKYCYKNDSMLTYNFDVEKDFIMKDAAISALTKFVRQAKLEKLLK